MEKFIREGEFLLTNYEWAGGHIPKASVVAARAKLVNNGSAVVVKPENYFKNEKSFIKRKGFNHK